MVYPDGAVQLMVPAKPLALHDPTGPVGAGIATQLVPFQVSPKAHCAVTFTLASCVPAELCNVNVYGESGSIAALLVPDVPFSHSAPFARTEADVVFDVLQTILEEQYV